MLAKTCFAIAACVTAALALVLPQTDDSVRITGETTPSADGTDWLRRDVKRDEEDDGSYEWRRGQ